MADNTGYRLDRYKDINPYSPTYGNIKTEKVYDTSMCPIPVSGEIVYKIVVPSNNYTDVAFSKTYSFSGGLYNGCSVLIDWGDGSNELIPITQTDVSHTYTLAGEYIINVSVAEIGSGGIISSFTMSKLTSEIIKYKLTFKTYFNTIIKPTNTLITLIEPSDYNIIRTNEDNNENIGSFGYMSNLVEVQDGDWSKIFNNKCIGYGSMFAFDSKLQTIPTHIMSGLKPRALGSMFYENQNLVLNINDFFDNVDLSNVDSVNSMFYNCKKITGSALPIISRLNHLSSYNDYYKCFYNCTSLSDYNSIPANWKAQ